MPSLELEGARVDFEGDEEKVKATYYYDGIRLGSDTFDIKDAIDGKFGYHKTEYDYQLGKVEEEFWIRWLERKVVLVLITHFGGVRSQKEVWADL
ncbi:hypothetical protein CON24_17215 [Bacillus cereus]|uniref:hypothetical protein n=1 Tax=Bacillus cereus TaxID=1396 RepID=UPI000BEC8BB1|nr:hypothetical protein [Bacillus cereus]PED36879.1 hypothetical protein CON24_17215 [Bacillus cereus]WIK94407.1 hypothetical protein QPL86_18875 [Bacillus bombysepticus]